MALFVQLFSCLVPWLGSELSRRSHLGSLGHSALTSPGGGVSSRHCLMYRPRCSGGDVSDELKENFDENNRVTSRMTGGLTEAGSTTVFSSLHNVWGHPHFLPLPQPRPPAHSLLLLPSRENISMFLQHALGLLPQILWTRSTAGTVSFRSSLVPCMCEHTPIRRLL